MSTVPGIPGEGILLNTSFPLQGETIVGGARDALHGFPGGGLSTPELGNGWVEK